MSIRHYRFFAAKFRLKEKHELEYFFTRENHTGRSN